MAYLTQFYQGSEQLPNGKILEVRYAVNRIAASFEAEPEEHYCTPMWLINEIPADEALLEKRYGRETLNRVLSKALPLGPPSLDGGNFNYQ